MGSCEGASEDLDMENDEKFLDAAVKDDKLAAKLLLSFVDKWTAAEAAEAKKGKEVVLPPTRWGSRVKRSTGTAASKGDQEEAAARRASPTTPLSWSGGGGSGTSGSVCGDGEANSQRPPAEKSKKRPMPRKPCRAAVAEATMLATVGIFSGGGSNKDEVVLLNPVPLRSCGPAEPWTSKMPNQGANDTTDIGRPGKRKTLLELRDMQTILLQEREELLKELEKQREIHHSMLEENSKLIKISNPILQSPVVSNPSIASLISEEAEPEQDQHLQCNLDSRTVKEFDALSLNVSEEREPKQLKCMSSSYTKQAPGYLFDLNNLPQYENLDMEA